MPMPLLIVIAVWFAVSIPVSVAAIFILRSRREPELVGMAGSDAVYVGRDGKHIHVPLGVSSAPR
jgi:hypothetical protein